MCMGAGSKEHVMMSHRRRRRTGRTPRPRMSLRPIVSSLNGTNFLEAADFTERDAARSMIPGSRQGPDALSNKNLIVTLTLCVLTCITFMSELSQFQADLIIPLFDNEGRTPSRQVTTDLSKDPRSRVIAISHELDVSVAYCGQ